MTDAAVMCSYADTDDGWIRLAAAAANVVAYLELRKWDGDAGNLSASILRGGNELSAVSPAVTSINSDVAGKTALASPTRNPVPAVDSLTWGVPTAVPALPLVAFARDERASDALAKLEAGEEAKPASEERDSDAVKASVTDGSHSPELRVPNVTASETGVTAPASVREGASTEAVTSPWLPVTGGE